MTSQVKGLLLLPLLIISGVGSKVPSSLKTTKHKNFSFWYHINKLHTQINQLAITAKKISHTGIQLCVASVVNIISQAAWKTSLAYSTFRSHQNTDHTCDCQRHSQTKCRHLTAEHTAHCLHAIHNVVVRLYTGNGSDISDDCVKLSYKNCK
jgi:hypothetical protein